MRIIDGSKGEGGGQILRSTLTLAAMTGEAVKIEKIRAGREKPGLRPQHLTAVRAAAALCAAQLEGAEVNSRALTFIPQSPVCAGDYFFDVMDAAAGGSAGAVTLILQTVLLPLALAQGASRVTLRGGTDVPWSPPAFYVEQVYLPMLAQMGIEAQLKINRHGFYPMGGGELVLELSGGAVLKPQDWTERGELLGIEGIAYVGNLPSHIPQRMVDRAGALLKAEELTATIEPRHITAQGQGAAIFLRARYEHVVAGFSSLGKKGVSSEDVAEAVVTELLDFHYGKGVFDSHLGDQMVLPMALAGGTAQAAVAEVTGHLQTNVWTVSQFPVAPLRVEGREGRAGLLWVESQNA